MRLGLKVFFIAMTVLVAASQPFALASDSASVTAGEQTSTENMAQTSTTAPQPNDHLAVENVQDIAYTLQRIRQQAINIYIESTRKPVSRFDVNIISLCAMPTTALESESAYLPLRKAWLVFFIGTMEPLVQILNEHIKHLDEKTEKCHMSNETLCQWQGFRSEWKTTIKKLNEQLDGCAAFIDDCAPDNVEVAKAARSINDQVSLLEDILHRAAKFLRENMPAS